MGVPVCRQPPAAEGVEAHPVDGVTRFVGDDVYRTEVVFVPVAGLFGLRCGLVDPPFGDDAAAAGDVVNMRGDVVFDLFFVEFAAVAAGVEVDGGAVAAGLDDAHALDVVGEGGVGVAFADVVDFAEGGVAEHAAVAAEHGAVGVVAVAGFDDTATKDGGDGVGAGAFAVEVAVAEVGFVGDVAQGVVAVDFGAGDAAGVGGGAGEAVEAVISEIFGELGVQVLALDEVAYEVIAVAQRLGVAGGADVGEVTVGRIVGVGGGQAVAEGEVFELAAGVDILGGPVGLAGGGVLDFFEVAVAIVDPADGEAADDGAEVVEDVGIDKGVDAAVGVVGGLGGVVDVKDAGGDDVGAAEAVVGVGFPVAGDDVADAGQFADAHDGGVVVPGFDVAGDVELTLGVEDVGGLAVDHTAEQVVLHSGLVAEGVGLAHQFAEGVVAVAPVAFVGVVHGGFTAARVVGQGGDYGGGVGGGDFGAGVGVFVEGRGGRFDQVAVGVVAVLEAGEVVFDFDALADDVDPFRFALVAAVVAEGDGGFEAVVGRFRVEVAGGGVAAEQVGGGLGDGAVELVVERAGPVGGAAFFEVGGSGAQDTAAVVVMGLTFDGGAIEAKGDLAQFAAQFVEVGVARWRAAALGVGVVGFEAGAGGVAVEGVPGGGDLPESLPIIAL